MDISNTSSVEINWKNKLNTVTALADELDLMKHGVRWEKGMIVFNSIAPDEKLFDVENFKRAFLTRMSIEGDIVLNYGYAKGYRPLMNYLLHYMEMKGVDISNKDILITNGFTEGLDIVLSSLSKNPVVSFVRIQLTSALKLFRLHGLEVYGIDMHEDGIDTNEVEKVCVKKILILLI